MVADPKAAKQNDLSRQLFNLCEFSCVAWRPDGSPNLSLGTP
jgi:hypothetical protein